MAAQEFFFPPAQDLRKYSRASLKANRVFRDARYSALTYGDVSKVGYFFASPIQQQGLV